MNSMNIGVVGLGLIGGSLARAIKLNTDHRVFGMDISTPIMKKAILLDVINEPLTEENIPDCDIVILCIYPRDTVRWVRDHAAALKPGTIVVDACGVKREICDDCWQIADEHGFTFIGGHPMDGIEKSGFEHSAADMFKGSSMIFVPNRDIDVETMKKLKDVFDAIGFGHYEMTNPEKHDRIIAYTSQLAHVVSSAYVKSPTAAEHKGYSAGSFKDMTRVAWLNEVMWAELFMENRDNLAAEIDALIQRLAPYSEALKSGDEAGLTALLREGREQKSRVDAL